MQAGGQCQEAAQSRLYQNSCSFSTSLCPHLVSECGVYKYMLSVCCENIIIYTGLQLSFRMILGVQTENLSSLPKKTLTKHQKPKHKQQNQTNLNNKPMPNLLWGGKNITWSHEEEVHGQVLYGMDVLSLCHVAKGQ